MDREALRRDYVLTIPELLLLSEPMQDACAARDFQVIFRLANRRAGASYADIAAAVRMSSPRISDIVRGVRKIRGQQVIERIADGLGIPGEMLGVPQRSWEASSNRVEDTDTARDSTGSVSISRGEGRAQYEWMNSYGPDLIAIAELRQRVQGLDNRYVTEPSTALIVETGKHLGQLAHWQTQTTKYNVRRDLLAAQAETATFMGKLVWDTSGRTDHATARTYLAQAAVAARELRDPVAEGVALLRTSFISLYGERNPRAGLETTLSAATTTGGTSHILTGLAILHAAEAYAMLKDRRECENALIAAERSFEKADMNDAGAAMYSPSQFGRLAGSCFLSLDDTARAGKILEDAAKECREGSKSQAIALGNLALAYTRQGMIEEAAETLSIVIDVVERHRGGGGLNLAFQAGRELQAWRNMTIVRDLNDRLFSLIGSI